MGNKNLFKSEYLQVTDFFLGGSDVDQWLSQYSLKQFDFWWSHDFTTVEKANVGRGGWSQVFQGTVGGRHIYIKRQEDYYSKVQLWESPILTFEKEFHFINLLSEIQLACVQPVFLATLSQRPTKQSQFKKRAVLVTWALDGYLPFDQFWQSQDQVSDQHKVEVLFAIGQWLGSLHRHGMLHNCFYPKHVFVKTNPLKIRVIDFEKVSCGLRAWLQKDRDLETFKRRSVFLSESDREVITRGYLESKDGTMQALDNYKWFISN